jgi:outer membrane protein W
MKKVFLAALISGLYLSAGAQSKFSLGPQAGFGGSTISNLNDSKYKAAGNVGLSLVYSVVEHFGLGADVKYSFEGAKTEANNVSTEIDLNYVRIPVKAIFFFNNYGDRLRPKIAVGPTFGFLTSATQQVGSGSEVDIKDNLETFDFGLHGGVGLNYRLVKNTWFNADVTYTHGFTEITTAADRSNRNLQLNVGVNFGL